MANSPIIRKAVLLIGALAVCGANYIGSSSAGEKRVERIVARAETHEHLSLADQRLTFAAESVTEAPNERARQSAEVYARSLLPSIEDPDSRLMWEAAILAQARDYDRAGIVLSHVKNFDRGTFYCLKLAAKTNAMIFKTDNAIELCTLALKRKKDEGLLALRANSYMTNGKFLEASKDYAEAATISYPAMNYCRATSSMIKMNEPGKGLVYAEKALQSASERDLAACYLVKGLCLERLNRPKEAVAAFTEALDRKTMQLKKSAKAPTDYGMFASNCLTERSKCYEKLGMTAEAERDRKQKAEIAKKLEQELFGK